MITLVFIMCLGTHCEPVPIYTFTSPLNCMHAGPLILPEYLKLDKDRTFRRMLCTAHPETIAEEREA